MDKTLKIVLIIVGILVFLFVAFLALSIFTFGQLKSGIEADVADADASVALARTCQTVALTSQAACTTDSGVDLVVHNSGRQDIQSLRVHIVGSTGVSSHNITELAAVDQVVRFTVPYTEDIDLLRIVPYIMAESNTIACVDAALDIDSLPACTT